MYLSTRCFFATALLAAFTIGICSAQEIPWTYGNPPGFELKEPDYRLPLQIKQALVDNVQGVQKYLPGYEEVYREPVRLKTWLLSVLQDHRKGLMKVQDLASLTAYKLSDSGRKDLMSGKREDVAKAAEDFKNAGESLEKGKDALYKIEIIDQQIMLVQAWDPEAAQG